MPLWSKGRDGRCRAMGQIGLRLRRCGARHAGCNRLSSTQPDNMCRFAYKLYFSVGKVVEDRRNAFVRACNNRKTLLNTILIHLCSSRHGFRDIEGLQIKVNPFPSSYGLPSIYIGPLAGLYICYKLVSDLLKLDILVTKASPHFPRLK